MRTAVRDSLAAWARSLRRREWRAVVGAGLAAAVVLVGVGAVVARFVAPPPDARPAGASDARILDVVRQQLDTCTGSDWETESPVLCPNLGDFHDDEDPAWMQAGDPVQGAVVRYSGRGLLTVRGRLVAIMSDAGAGGPYLPQVDATPYEAFVAWDGGRPTVVRVDRTPDGPPVPRPAGATDLKAIAAGTDSFGFCAGAPGTLLATNCPPPGVQPCGDTKLSEAYSLDQGDVPRVTWGGDGIAHIAGTYSQDETSTSATPGCPASQTDHVSGTYDLWLVWDPTSDNFQVVEGVYRLR